MTNTFVSFFEKIGHDLDSVFKSVFKSTSWESKALATISYAEPFVNGILELADPEIAPIVAKIIGEVTAALSTVKTVVQAGTVPPGSPAAEQVVAALGSVKSNLSALLADAHVKNATKISEITAAVNVVNGEVDALLQNSPVAPAVSA